jgi:GTP-dependent phosphoenolpyruvate carboxykinase
MNEAKQEILNIIANYCKENPNQRFGQILFNLNINEFKKDSEEIRDIYNDFDETIFERVQIRIQQLKNR